MWNMTLSVDDVMISQLTETVSGGLSPPAGHTGNLSMSHHLFILNFHLHSHRLRLPWRWGRQQHDAAVWCQHVVRTDKLLLVSHLLSGHHAKTQYTTTFSSWTKQTWNHLRLVLNRFSCYESTRILSFKNHKKKKKTVILCWNLTNWSSRHGSTCRDCEWTLLLHLSSCSLISDSLTWSLIVPADDCQLSLNDLHSSRLLHISKLVYIERPVIMSQISSSYSQLFLLHSHFIIISSCFCRRKQFLNFSLWGV